MNWTRGRLGALCIAALFMLSACKMMSASSLSRLADAKDPKKVASQLWKEQKNYYKNNPDALVKDVQAFVSFIQQFEKDVGKTWGNDDNEVAGRNTLVKYTDNFKSRAKVDFAAGQVIVQTLATDNPKSHLKQAIISTVLAPDDPNQIDLFSADPVTFNGRPYLYNQVLDEDRKPIAFAWRAGRFADHLLKNAYETIQDGNKLVHQVSFPLVRNHTELRKIKFKPFVQTAAKRYGLSEALIYAIIETESSFNPFAVSHASAIGLMQVVPSTAGRDVYQRIKKRKGQPTRNTLFDPASNIDIGSAYLHILDTVYLKDIRIPLSREYAIISAYNGGAGNLLKTFSKDKKKATRLINQLKPEGVFWKLKTQHPKQESRRYLEKVTKAKQTYQ